MDRTAVGWVDGRDLRSRRLWRSWIGGRGEGGGGGWGFGIAPEGVGLDGAAVAIPGGAEAEDVAGGAGGVEELIGDQKEWIAAAVFEVHDDLFVEDVLGDGPEGAADGGGNEADEAGLVVEPAAVLFEVVTHVAEAGLADGAELPLGAVDGGEGEGAEAADPVGTGVGEGKGHAFGVVLDPEGVGDGAHEGMADVVVEHGVAVGPDGVLVAGDGGGVTGGPVAVGGLVAIPVAGIEVGGVLPGDEDGGGDEQLLPVNAAFAGVGLVVRAVLQRDVGGQGGLWEGGCCGGLREGGVGERRFVCGRLGMEERDGGENEELKEGEATDPAERYWGGTVRSAGARAPGACGPVYEHEQPPYTRWQPARARSRRTISWAQCTTANGDGLSSGD